MSKLRSLVERIENLEQQIAEFNGDKRDVYAEAKSVGFDIAALKAVIAHRRNSQQATELREMVDLYLAHLSGINNATRAPARARPIKEPVQHERSCGTVEPVNDACDGHVTGSSIPDRSSSPTSTNWVLPEKDTSGPIPAPPLPLPAQASTIHDRPSNFLDREDRGLSIDPRDDIRNQPFRRGAVKAAHE